MEDELNRPNPPRYWWLKRLGAAYLALVLLTVGVRVWWAHSANRRLDALVAQYRAAGEPVLAEDFETAPVPDEQNAAHFYAAAGKAIVVGRDDEQIFWNVTLSATTGADDRAVITRVLSQNQQAFDLVRRARNCPGADWGISFNGPAVTVVLPSLGDVRSLAHVLNLAAIDAYLRHNDAAAIEHLHDGFRLTAAVGTSPTIVSHLVQLATDQRFVTTLEQLLWELRIDQSNARQLRELLKALLDEEPLQHSFEQGLYYERWTEIDTPRRVANGELSVFGLSARDDPLPNTLEWLAGPTFLEDAITMAGNTTATLHALREPDLASVNAKGPRALKPPSSVQGTIVHLQRMFIYANLSRAFGTHFQDLRTRRRAAVAVAARLYAFDHGRPPARIEDLIPQYLPAVPLDPVVGGSTPMRLPGGAATSPSPPPPVPLD